MKYEFKIRSAQNGIIVSVQGVYEPYAPILQVREFAKEFKRDELLNPEPEEEKNLSGEYIFVHEKEFTATDQALRFIRNMIHEHGLANQRPGITEL